MKKFWKYFIFTAVGAGIFIFAFQIGKKNKNTMTAGVSTEREYPYVLYSQGMLYPYGEKKDSLLLSYDIALLDLRTSKIMYLTRDGLKSRFCASEDGKIYYSFGLKDAEDLWVVDLKKKTRGLFLGRNSYVSGSGASAFQHYAAAPSCSHDGKYVAFEGNPAGYRSILRVDADGKNLKPLSHSASAHCGSPEYSPDDKLIAYDCLPVLGDNKYGNFAIWVMRADGTGQQMVFSDPGVNSHRPVWRPKGERWLLFYSMIGSKYGIRAILLDANNKVLRLVKLIDDGFENMNAHWSPDGKYVIYQTNRPYADNAGNIIEDYDVYAFEFNPDLPCRSVAVTKGNFKEINPFWCGFSNNEIWGSDLSGYLSDGIAIDSSAIEKQNKKDI